MLILIDNYDSFTYNLYQILAQVYADKIFVVRNNKISVDEIFNLHPDGIILSPGPGKPEDAGICVALIQKLSASSSPLIPVLGVCLGHQAIGKAFGADIIRAPEVKHGKEDSVTFKASLLYQSLPQTISAGRYHSLIIDKSTLSDHLKINAENEQGIIMGIEHKALPIYGVQFHPESILTPQGGTLINAFVKLCQ